MCCGVAREVPGVVAFAAVKDTGESLLDGSSAAHLKSSIRKRTQSHIVEFSPGKQFCKKSSVLIQIVKLK